jgi:UDP-N-acetylglucosamine acyltransferase
MTRVHPTAIVDPRAELGRDVTVGPYAIVGAGVTLGDECELFAHAVVEGPSRIGARNRFFPFSVTGSAAQHKRPQTRLSRLELGDDNVVREHVTIHRGTDGHETRVGSGNLFMVGVHVAHDVTVGSQCTLANGVQLAGHVHVDDHVTFGGLAAIGQFVRIGESAFIAGGAMVEQNVPPFVIAQGDRARVRALNKVGLVRRGIPEASRRALEDAFRVLYKSGLPRSVAVTRVAQTDPFVLRLCAFFSAPSSEPGVGHPSSPASNA